MTKEYEDAITKKSAEIPKVQQCTSKHKHLSNIGIRKTKNSRTDN